MTPQELFEDAARRPSQVAQHVLEGASPEVLNTMPGGTANSVAWLVWHAARQQDAQVADLAGTEEVWTAQGWNGRFGLDLPDSSMGFGHGPDDVARVRVASAEPLQEKGQDEAETPRVLLQLVPRAAQVVPDTAVLDE